MQSDRNSFGGYVVLNGVYMACIGLYFIYLYQIYEKQINLEFIMEIQNL